MQPSQVSPMTGFRHAQQPPRIQRRYRPGFAPGFLFSCGAVTASTGTQMEYLLARIVYTKPSKMSTNKSAENKENPVRTNFLTGFHWRSERDLLHFRYAKTKVRLRPAVAGNAHPRCIYGLQIPSQHKTPAPKGAGVCGGVRGI